MLEKTIIFNKITAFFTIFAFYFILTFKRMFKKTFFVQLIRTFFTISAIYFTLPWLSISTWMLIWTISSFVFWTIFNFAFFVYFLTSHAVINLLSRSYFVFFDCCSYFFLLSGWIISVLIEILSTNILRLLCLFIFWTEVSVLISQLHN